MEYRPVYNKEFGKLGVDVAQQWPEWDLLKQKGKKKDTLGIALSGGGYRSAIFCYGVLRGFHEIGVLKNTDYLSVVSGGSWIGMSYATTNFLDKWFFDRPESKPNYLEEGFESFLANPIRLSEELMLTRLTPNYVSDVYGRLIAGTFLREHGQDARYRVLSDQSMIKESDRPYLVVNGTLKYRPKGENDLKAECFEMTRLYCGSRSLGYTPTEELKSLEEPIRVRDAVAISGAAAAVFFPGLGDEVVALGLDRKVVNYTPKSLRGRPTDNDLDLADGGLYNNLGVESLINRGCGYIIIVDAEHDPESPDDRRSHQKYSGLRTLMKRNHIKTAFGNTPDDLIAQLDLRDELVTVRNGGDTVPDILYIKLKSWSEFNMAYKNKPYNKPGFLDKMFRGGEFAFDPQFSTAKLDYSFAEHRNLSDLGYFVVKQHADKIKQFASLAN